MSYIGIQRGRRKALASVRMVHDGAGNAALYQDNAFIGNVTVDIGGVWGQIFASLAQSTNNIEIFDSTGETMALGTGAAASEVILLQVVPGGNEWIHVRIDQGERLALTAISARPLAGTETVINFYD